MRWMCYAIVSFALLHWSAPLRITYLDVPKTAWNSAALNCRYDLEGQEFYAAKWYKDNVEFFRCIKNGSTYDFPTDGVTIYTNGFSHIGTCFLELRNLNEESSGKYTCEVSLDWPTFGIVTQSATLRVIDPPPNEAGDDYSYDFNLTEETDSQLHPVMGDTNFSTGTQKLPLVFTQITAIMLICFVFLDIC